MFKNFVALVTGGSSSIGRATAEYFAGKGARVVLSDLSTSNGAAIAKAIGNNTLFLPADVSLENDVQSMLTQTKKKFGKLNIIVNCHTVSAPFACHVYDFKTKQPHKLEDFQKILTASTLGTFNVVRLGVGLIAENAPDIDGEKGVIINTISAASGLPSLGQVANETASASIEAMTRVWAVEFAPQGIRTVAIAHGNIKEGKKSTKNALGAPQHFAQLAHMVVTMPYINATTITLDGAIKS